VTRALDFTGLSSGERSQILIANLHTPLFSRYHFHPREGISLFGLSALTWRGIIKRSNTRAIYSALLSGGRPALIRLKVYSAAAAAATNGASGANRLYQRLYQDNRMESPDQAPYVALASTKCRAIERRA